MVFGAFLWIQTAVNNVVRTVQNLFLPVDFNENHIYGNTPLPQVISSAESDYIQPSKYQNVPNTNIGIGTLVEVNPGKKTLCS